MNTIKNSLLKLYTKIGSSSIFNFFINNITKKFCKESIQIICQDEVIILKNIQIKQKILNKFQLQSANIEQINIMTNSKTIIIDTVKLQVMQSEKRDNKQDQELPIEQEYDPTQFIQYCIDLFNKTLKKYTSQNNQHLTEEYQIIDGLIKKCLVNYKIRITKLTMKSETTTFITKWCELMFYFTSIDAVSSQSQLQMQVLMEIGEILFDNFEYQGNSGVKISIQNLQINTTETDIVTSFKTKIYIEEFVQLITVTQLKLLLYEPANNSLIQIKQIQFGQEFGNTHDQQLNNSFKDCFNEQQREISINNLHITQHLYPTLPKTSDEGKNTTQMIIFNEHDLVTHQHLNIQFDLQFDLTTYKIQGSLTQLLIFAKYVFTKHLKANPNHCCINTMQPNQHQELLVIEIDDLIINLSCLIVRQMSYFDQQQTDLLMQVNSKSVIQLKDLQVFKYGNRSNPTKYWTLQISQFIFNYHQLLSEFNWSQIYDDITYLNDQITNMYRVIDSLIIKNTNLQTGSCDVNMDQQKIQENKQYFAFQEDVNLKIIIEQLQVYQYPIFSSFINVIVLDCEFLFKSLSNAITHQFNQFKQYELQKEQQFHFETQVNSTMHLKFMLNLIQIDQSDFVYSINGINDSLHNILILYDYISQDVTINLGNFGVNLNLQNIQHISNIINSQKQKQEEAQYNEWLVVNEDFQIVDFHQHLITQIQDYVCPSENLFDNNKLLNDSLSNQNEEYFKQSNQQPDQTKKINQPNVSESKGVKQVFISQFDIVINSQINQQVTISTPSFNQQYISISQLLVQYSEYLFQNMGLNNGRILSDLSKQLRHKQQVIFRKVIGLIKMFNKNKYQETMIIQLNYNINKLTGLIKQASKFI